MTPPHPHNHEPLTRSELQRGLLAQLWSAQWFIYLALVWIGSAVFTSASHEPLSELVALALSTCSLMAYIWSRAQAAPSGPWRALTMGGAALSALLWGAAHTQRFDQSLREPLIAWRAAQLRHDLAQPLRGEVRSVRRRGERWSALLTLHGPQGLGLPPINALYRSASLSPEITAGAEVWLTPPLGSGASLSAPSAPPEPLAFDMRAHLRGLGASVEARGELWFAQGGSWLQRRLRGAREALIERLQARGEAGRVALAIGLGDARQLNPDRSAELRRMGLAHLFAVSGLHVGGLALLLAWVCAHLARLLGSLRPRRWSLLGALVGAWLLTFMVGSPLSAQRAAYMVSALCLGRLLSLRLSPLGALVVAGYLITFMSPWRAQGLSFQLSWWAVLGLCALTPRLDSRLWTALWSSVSASLATAPLLAWSFGVAAPLSALTNLLVTPLASLTALPLCLFGALLSLGVHLCVGAEGGWLSGAALSLGDQLSLSGAQLLLWWVSCLPEPLAYEVPVGRAGSVGFCLLALLTLSVSDRVNARFTLQRLKLLGTEHMSPIWGAVLKLKRQGRVTIVVLAASASSLCVFKGLSSHKPSVTFLSVGQGDATLLMNGEGGVGLFDVGPRYGGRAVGEALVARGVKRVDWVAISHLHPDHYGGLFKLLEQVEVEEVLFHGRAPKPHRAWGGGGQSADIAEGSWRSLARRLRERGTPLIEAQAGLQRWGALNLDWVLTSPPEPLKENDASLSLLVYPEGAEGRAVLLSGDLEGAGERRLAERWGQRGRAFIWQADHHGSNTSTHEGLLALLQPRLSLISVGEKNRYGFPHPEVISRLSERGVSWLRTDLAGHVTALWEPDGSLRVLSEGRGLPSW